MAKEDAPQIRVPNEWDKFLEKLPLEKKLEVLRIQEEGEFLTWSQANAVENPHTLWLQRYDTFFSPGSLPEDRANKKPEEKKIEDVRRRTRIGYREPTYEEFQEGSREEAEKRASEWENSPDPAVATSRQQAYDASLRKTHDDFVRNYERLANKWVKEHNDALLVYALERKRLEDEARKRKEKQKILDKIQQAQNLEQRTSRLSRLRSKTSLFLRKNSQETLSYSSRFIKKSVVRPTGIAVRTLGSNVMGKGISFAVRLGIAISRLLALVGGITLGSVAIPFAIICLVVLGIILFFTVVRAIVPGSPSSENPLVSSPYPGIGYSVYGPKTAKKGVNFTDSVELIYDLRTATCSLESITLVDMIPPGTTVVEEQTTGNFTKTDSTVLWKLSPENTPYTESSIVKIYRFEILFNSKDNLTVQNGVYIEGCGDPIIPGIKQQPPLGDKSDQTGLYDGADSRPTNDYCGKYDNGNNGEDGTMTKIQKKWPKLGDKTNYGDPLCSYSDAKFDKVIELTETKHPENISFWKDIAQSEGSSPNSTGVPEDAEEKGTWGRFQMRRSFPLPGKTWDPEKNDRGDVPWQKQIANAISKNNSDTDRGHAFDYWGTAYCICWWPKYRTAPYCQDLIKNNKIRDPQTCQNDRTDAIGKRGPRQ